MFRVEGLRVSGSGGFEGLRVGNQGISVLKYVVPSKVVSGDTRQPTPLIPREEPGGLTLNPKP